MQVTRGSSPAVPRPVALTIGNFDGIHRGHQAVLVRLMAEARARDLPSAVLTFEPHPREFFDPERAPTRLTSLREKLALLEALGVDLVHVQHFDQTFATLTAAQFIDPVLVRQLRAKLVLIGDDFCFGARRAGDFAMLEAASHEKGFELIAMPTIGDAGERISSSAVREALRAGDLARARSLLGRHYSMTGRVIRGRQLGRELGWPTANVQLRHNRPPLTGIFAVRVHGADSRPRDAVASLGYRPTVEDEGRALLEVYLFDFAGDLYGRLLTVELLHKLRDEAKFESLDALRAQIAQDCDDARALLQGESARALLPSLDREPLGASLARAR
jgi:riboflavin kinase/FMN adenylyltransferase